MGQDALIQVFGKIDDAATLKLLGQAMLDDHSTYDNQEDFESAEEAAIFVIEQAKKGEPILLSKYDTSYTFGHVRDYCVNNGLAYAMNLGEPGDETYSRLITWSPGWSEPEDIFTDNDEPLINLRELKILAAGGIDKVNEQIRSLEEKTLQNAVKIIEVTPEIIAEFERQPPKI